MRNEQLISSSDVCDYCGFSVSVLNRLEREGVLRPSRVLPGSRKRLYSWEVVESYMENVKKEAEESAQEEEELMTSSEVCEYCCFSRPVLDRLESQGLLVPVKVLPKSGKRFYAVNDVVTYRESIRKR